MRRSSSVVYLIAAEDGPVKVGVSCDASNRLRSLQCGSSRRLVIHKVWPCGEFAGRFERHAHDALKAYHIGGEWFSISSDQAVLRIDEIYQEIGLFAYSTPVQAPDEPPIEILAMLDAGGFLRLPGGMALLNGGEIAGARRLSGIGTQQALADAAGLGRATVERAERAKDQIPGVQTAVMEKIVRALEAAGIEFTLEPGRSLNGGVGMRRRGS